MRVTIAMVGSFLLAVLLAEPITTSVALSKPSPQSPPLPPSRPAALDQPLPAMLPGIAAQDPANPPDDPAYDPEFEGPPPPPPDISAEMLCHTLASVAQAHRLPTGFFARLIWQESRHAQRAVSPAGALGVAQFMPMVAVERGLLNPFDALSALPHSARFLKEHERNFGNLGLAAAAYNAGARRVTEWLARRGPLPDETRNYVRRITGQEPESWIEAEDLDLTLALPRRNPCEGVADLSHETAPARIAVRIEPPMQKIISDGRLAAAKAAAEAKSKRLTALLKTERGRKLVRLPGQKRKRGEDGKIAQDKPKEKTLAENTTPLPVARPVAGKPVIGKDKRKRGLHLAGQESRR